MAAKRKTVPTKLKLLPKDEPTVLPTVENIMTENVSILIPPSRPVSRKRPNKATKGFVETVKDDVRSVVKAVAKFARRNAPKVPPPRKSERRTIVPPFTPPI